MKRIVSTLLCIILVMGCHRETAGYLIGVWDDTDSEIAIVFHEDGMYSWHLPWPGVDPNTGMGRYTLSGDTLRIEEYTYTGDTLVNYYIVMVERKSLQLRNLETNEVKNYTR